MNTPELRTRLPEPNVTPQQAEKRRCACGTVLARDNHGTLCGACEKRESDARFEATLAQAQEREAARKPRREVLRVGRIQLEPRPLPVGRQRTGEYAEAIREFLASNEVCCAVQVPSRKPSAIYSSLRGALDALKESRCYPCVRGGECYLIRKPVK